MGSDAPALAQPRSGLRRWLVCTSVFLLYFLLALAAAFHSGMRKTIAMDPGHPSAQRTVNVSASASELQATWDPTADVMSYLRAGVALSDGLVVEEMYMRHWPPGMPVVIAGIRLLTGLDAYSRKLIIVSCLAWALCFTTIFGCRPDRDDWSRSSVFAFCFPLGLFLLPTWREWTFGVGSILSESLTTASMIAGGGLLARGLVQSSFRDLLLSGLALGVSANLRMYSMMSLRATLVALFIGALAVLFHRLERPRLRNLFAVRLSPPNGTNEDARCALGLAVVLAVFFVALAPWSIYKLQHAGVSGWNTAPRSYNYGRMWMPDRQQVHWAVAANAQCRALPDFCELLDENRERIDENLLLPLGVMATVLHPGKIIRDKLEGFAHFWFGVSWTELREKPAFLLEGLYLLLSGILGLAWFAWRLRIRPFAALGLVALGLTVFLAYNVALFTFHHFEWRFSMPLRSMAYFAPFWLWASTRGDVR